MPIHYRVIQYPKPMVQMAYCDLSHTFQVTNVSQHVLVILLWGILMFPLVKQTVSIYSRKQRIKILCRRFIDGKTNSAIF